MNKFLLKYCPEKIHIFYSKVKLRTRFRINPKSLASELFEGLLGYKINWEDPKDLNEKINWMKFNYDTTIWTDLADKYRVRKYVKERIGEDVLTKLYGVWSNADQIDFDKLPPKFIFKTNQGQGTVMPIPNKSELDINRTKKQLNDWVKLKYGYETIEPHYLKIRPLILAEQLLENDSKFSTSLVDYKVYCFSGKPYCILVCSDRTIGKKAHYSYYNCNWEPMPEVLKENLRNNFLYIPKPTCLNLLLDYAEKLAQGHPQVRVDFYIVNNKIYFGELTFTNSGGYDKDITREASLAFGEKINLSYK